MAAALVEIIASAAWGEKMLIGQTERSGTSGWAQDWNPSLQLLKQTPKPYATTLALILASLVN